MVFTEAGVGLMQGVRLIGEWAEDSLNNDNVKKIYIYYCYFSRCGHA